MIDLRSDTVTRPTPAMLAAMMAAPVGDDVFGEDPTVNALEQKAARLFGMEAALFCPSGTMTNQLAIRTHVRPGDEVICDQISHVYLYEGGGIAVNALASVALLAGERGKLTPALIAPAINNPGDVHRPISRLVSLENTVNKGGAAITRCPNWPPFVSFATNTGWPYTSMGHGCSTPWSKPAMRPKPTVGYSTPSVYASPRGWVVR